MQANLRIFKGFYWNNYKYNESYRRGNIVYYVCNNYKMGTCGARGVLKNDIFTVTKEHTHGPRTTLLKEEAFKRELCQAVLTNQCEQFKKIYDSVRLNHPEAAVTVTFSRIENAMFKWRQKVVPPSVDSLFFYVATINSNNWKHLTNYQNGTMNISLVIDEDLSHSVLFMDPIFVRKISVRGCFYLDATFKVVPTSTGAQQFLTILSRKYNNAIPCIWVLMERRTEASYKAVFLAIKRLIPEFEIDEALTDFEKALRNALRQIFPNAILYGCLFHHDQALLKNALKLGLKNILEQDKDAQHLFALIMSLALLPANVIPITYEEIRRSSSPYIRRKFASFFRYYEKQWLAGVKPTSFSVFMLTNRTNNCLEAYHKTLKAKFGIHPNMWAFSRNLLNLQENYDLELKSLQRGLSIRRLAKSNTTMKQALLLNAWSIFNEPNGFTPIEFLNHTLSFQSNTLEAYLALYSDD